MKGEEDWDGEEPLRARGDLNTLREADVAPATEGPEPNAITDCGRAETISWAGTNS